MSISSELKALNKSKENVKSNIDSIDSELQKIKEGKGAELNLEESEKIESSWLAFITQSKLIISKLERNIGSLVESLNKKSSPGTIKELESEVLELKSEIELLKEEPNLSMVSYGKLGLFYLLVSQQN